MESGWKDDWLISIIFWYFFFIKCSLTLLSHIRLPIFVCVTFSNGQNYNGPKKKHLNPFPPHMDRIWQVCYRWCASKSTKDFFILVFLWLFSHMQVIKIMPVLKILISFCLLPTKTSTWIPKDTCSSTFCAGADQFPFLCK